MYKCQKCYPDPRAPLPPPTTTNIEQYTLQLYRLVAKILSKRCLQSTTVDAAIGYNNHNLLCISYKTHDCCRTRLPEYVSDQVHAAGEPTCLAYTGLESASGSARCLEYQVPRERGQGLKEVKGKSNLNMDSWPKRNNVYCAFFGNLYKFQLIPAFKNIYFDNLILSSESRNEKVL